MAKKKETKTVKEKTKKKLKSGEVIYIPIDELPGTTLGGVYEYKGNKVRLVCINEISKLIVE